MSNRKNCNVVKKYVDVNKIDLDKWENAESLMGLDSCGDLTVVEKPNYTDKGAGNKALFDDGVYKEVLTKGEAGEDLDEVKNEIKVFKETQDKVNESLNDKDSSLQKQIISNKSDVDALDSKVSTNKSDIQYIKNNYLDKDSVNSLATKAEVKAVEDITEVNRELIDRNRKDINSLLEGEDSYTHFRGLYPTIDSLKLTEFPKVNDFAYVEETHTKWRFTVDGKWADTKEVYARDTRNASVEALADLDSTVDSIIDDVDELEDDFDLAKEQYNSDKELQKEIDENQDKRIDDNRVKISESNQEIKVIKDTLKHLNSNDEIQEAKGGSMINLPNNAMKSVVPNYRFEGLTVQNLVNGDFSDGNLTDDFSISGKDTQLEQGKDHLIIKTNDNYGGFVMSEKSKIHKGVINEGDKIYIFSFAKQKEGGRYYLYAIGVGSSREYISNDWTLNSFIIEEGNREKYNFGIRTSIFEEGDDIETLYVKTFGVLNLTRIFGAGNEPSKEWCDANLPDYVEGTKSVQLPMRVKSVDEDTKKESLAYFNDEIELKSVGEVKDYIENGKLYKNISDEGEILEEAEIINLNTSGLIEAKPNGTVFFEPITNITGFYDNGLDVEGLDILEVEEFSHLVNGVYQSLDVSKVKVEGGKLTHPDAQNGLVYLVYRYDDNPVYGESTISYYNNNRVLESPNGTFFKPVFSIDDEGNITMKGEKL